MAKFFSKEKGKFLKCALIKVCWQEEAGSEAFLLADLENIFDLLRRVPIWK